ncbi:BgTH12-01277 [Blumeria graminis f. sp. triticale]|uniref:BgTH12-01277 n=1 Tax=Blumeria graminis f. sp. triticale TaxID=1689686 RepID=A0A9W4GJC9_BLUGR|nr:BgTH12-01277 [Blumeria graminis f. sp. triticale]
MIACSTVPALF